MKVILTIGSSDFLANTATQAAKIAELLGNLTPISIRYTATDKINRCSVIEADFTHTVNISSAKMGELMTPEDFAKFDADQQAIEMAAKEAKVFATETRIPEFNPPCAS